MSAKQEIYMDCAATTPVSERVRSAMEPYFSEKSGNPSSLYRRGREAARAEASARKRIAEVLGCLPEELYFTSGGTESDNWAVKGTAFAHGPGGHFVSSAIEHHAVLHSLRFVETLGNAVTLVCPGEDGIVRTEDFIRAFRKETVLVSCMLANNEIGTIQPVRELADAAHARGIPVFCDAVQAMGQIPFDIPRLGADLLSLSGHKIHAPKGIGLLYIRKGIRIAPLLDGGSQEFGMRAGTQSLPLIMGFAQAVEDAAECREGKAVSALRDQLVSGLSPIEGILFNGTYEEGKRLPGNVNVSFPGLDSEGMVLLLDARGLAVSAGSACNAGSTKPSHVLKAIGRTDAAAAASLRFTLSGNLTEDEIARAVQAVRDVVCQLRRLQPESSGIQKFI